MDFLLARIAEDEANASSARMRAECAAKRAIIAEHAPFTHEQAGAGTWCRMCVHPTGWPIVGPGGGVHYPCLTVRLLAQPYADHPDAGTMFTTTPEEPT